MCAISVTEYLMGRSKLEDLDEKQQTNMRNLLDTINGLLAEFGSKRKVNSGYRRPVDNAACGGSPRSAHLTCEAVDLEDKDGKLKAFCTSEVLEKWDLYMEHPSKSPSWCHLQTRPVRSGNRIFYP